MDGHRTQCLAPSRRARGRSLNAPAGIDNDQEESMITRSANIYQDDRSGEWVLEFWSAKYLPNRGWYRTGVYATRQAALAAQQGIQTLARDNDNDQGARR